MLVQNTRTGHFNISNRSLLLVLAASFLVVAAYYAGIFNSAQPTTAAATLYQTHYSPHYGYSIEYPADWTVVDQSGMGVFSATSRQQTRVQGGNNFSQRQLMNPAEETVPAAGFSKIDVVVYELDGQLSAQDFMLAKAGVMPQGKVSEIKAGGQDAFRIDVSSSAALANHTDNTTYTNVYVTYGKYGYILAGFASPTVLNHIIGSLTFDAD